MTTRTDTDILIVGAGPVGLFLANECARRGLRYRIIEANATQSLHSKALAIFPRTMEIFDMAGVVAPFLEKANRVTNVAIFSRGHSLARLSFEPKESPYRFVSMVPQDVTEALLVQALAAKDGSVEYETSFVSARQEDGFVRASIDRKGQVSEVTAQFLVGCDGAHSAIRHLLDIPFQGGQYAPAFLLADIATNDTLPADEMQLCPNEYGPVAIFPMSSTRRRVVAMIDEPVGDAPSLDLVQKILRDRAPQELQALELHWSSYFRIHHRVVTKLREGRIFLAGDAAHIHSPFGGQGMNTGLHDVWNLIWKLDLYLRGNGTEALLDSYGAERLPVIKGVIDTTDFLTKALGTPSKIAQLLRDTVIPLVSHLAPFQHAFVQRLSELGIAYHGSPIVEGPGDRYFDESFRGGQTSGHSFALIVNGKDSEAMDAARTLSSAMPGLVRVQQSDERGLRLVRPDGYVAYQTHTGDARVAMDHVRALLQKQLGARNETPAVASNQVH